jgi:hypothetical protein
MQSQAMPKASVTLGWLGREWRRHIASLQDLSNWFSISFLGNILFLLGKAFMIMALSVNSPALFC